MNMIINFKKNVMPKVLLLSFFSILFLASCSSDDANTKPVPDDETPPSTANYYKVLRMENFGYALADGNDY